MEKLKELFGRLSERRLWQVAIAYAVVGWGVAQVVQFGFENYEISRKYLDVTLLLLALGFPAVLTLTWFHGEKGHQRAPRLEVLILTSLIVLAGIGTWRIARAEPDFAISADEATIDLGQESVAVLPFENRVADPDMEWLGAGIAELITTGLAQIPDLTVVSGQRLFDLLRREGSEDTERIPDALATRIASRAGAHYMVDGSILGRADDITVNANLIDVETGRVMAASKARGPDVFALVDSISVDLSAQILGAAVEPTEMASVADVTTRNLEAYRAFQQGVEAQRRWRVDEAFAHYRRAVELDPSFAIAHLRLAGLAFNNNDISTAVTALRAADQNRERATGRDRLFLDGMLANIQHGDTETAREKLSELIRLYPDDKEGRMALWQFYDTESDERRALIEEAIEIDPLFAAAYNELAYWHGRAGDHAAADSLIRLYAQLEPDQANPRDSRGELLEMAGDHEAARAAYLEALAVDPEFTISLNHLARSWILYENRPLEAVRDLEPFTRDSIPAVRIRAMSLTSEALLAAGQIDAGLEVARRALDEAASTDDPRDDSQLLTMLLPLYLTLGEFDALNAGVGRLQFIDPLNPIGSFVGFLSLGEQGQLVALRAYGAQIRAGVEQVPDLAQFAPLVQAFVDREVAYYTGEYERSVLMADSVRALGGIGFMGNFAEIESLLALERGEDALRRARQLEQQARRVAGGRVMPVTYRQSLYFQARAHELLGDTAKAIDLYRAMLDGWEDAARRIRSVSDAPDRLAALEATV